jgi:hypothetical protein
LDRKLKILETKHFRQVLILVASMVTTAPEFISEPVAGKVKTVRNNFRQISKSTFSLKYQLHLLQWFPLQKWVRHQLRFRHQQQE